MKIFRWFFSHSFLIILIVAVIYSYMYWGNLFGEDTPAGKAIVYLSDEFEEVDEFVAAIKQNQEPQAEASADSGEMTAAATQASDADSSKADADTEAGTDTVVSRKTTEIQQDSQSASPAVSTDSDATEAPATEASISETSMAENTVAVADATASNTYSHDQQRVEQDSSDAMATPATTESQSLQAQAAERDEQQPVATAAMAESADGAAPEVMTEGQGKGQDTHASVEERDNAQPAGGAAEDKFVSVEEAEQLDNVDDEGRVIDPTRSNAAVRQEWIKARLAFYKRDYRQSEKSYLDVIDNTQDNYDAYGELGNVYFNQGKRQQAAQAYFDAASILIKRGEKMRARSLMGLLRRLDAAKAAELNKLLEAPTG